MATCPTGKRIELSALCRIDTPVEAENYKIGSVLYTVLRRLLNQSKKGAKVTVGA